MIEDYCFNERIARNSSDNQYKNLRVYKETHEQVKQLAKDTNQDITVLAQILISFALERVKVVD